VGSTTARLARQIRIVQETPQGAQYGSRLHITGTIHVSTPPNLASPQPDRLDGLARSAGWDLVDSIGGQLLIRSPSDDERLTTNIRRRRCGDTAATGEWMLDRRIGTTRFLPKDQALHVVLSQQRIGHMCRSRRASPSPNAANEVILSVTKRGLFSVLSQGLNSGGNVILAIAVVRATTLSEFGAWSISYVGYAVALAFTRAVVSTPLMLDRVRGSDDSEAWTVRGAVSAAAIVGVLATAVLFSLGAAFPAGRQVCWAFAVWMPGLMLQDTARYIFFRARHAGFAALSDALWVILQVGAFGWLYALDEQSAVACSLAWGATGATSALVSLSLLRALPSLRAAIIFFREHRWVAGRLVVDAVLVSLSTQALPIAVASVAGLAVAGALRAAQIMMGGLNVVTAGLAPTMTVEAVRAVDDRRSQRSLLWRWCLMIVGIAAVYGAAVLAIPDSAGVRLLGDNWGNAEPLILPLVVHGVLRGPFTGVVILLRARGDLNGALRLRATTCVPALAIPTAGAFVWGSSGAAWGIAVSAVVINLLCWPAIRRPGESRATG
jgi:hypothetical protein